LLAPLMELIECLFGCVFFFHRTWSKKDSKSSNFIRPNL
jgi:hypothetical protein